MTTVVLLAGLLAAVLAAALTFSVRALGRRLLLLDSPGAAGHAKQLTSTPNIGGIAIVAAIALPLAAALVALAIPAMTADLPDAIAVHLDGARGRVPMAITLLLTLLAVHALGIIDDRAPLDWRIKLAVMLAAPLPLILAFDARLLTALDAPAQGSWLSVAITTLWFATVMNAMNFMDNADGLAAGTGAIASAGFLVAALMQGQWFVAGVLALLTGALLGFLVFNFPFRRASIYMGDGGSLPLGFLLAFLTVRTTYIEDDHAFRWYALLMPLCVLAVPLYDLVAVSAVRLSQGRSPFVGDQQHLSHRLMARGLTIRHMLGVVYTLTATTAIAGILLTRTDDTGAILIGTQMLLLIALIALLEVGSAGRVLSKQINS